MPWLPRLTRAWRARGRAAARPGHAGSRLPVGCAFGPLLMRERRGQQRGPRPWAGTLPPWGGSPLTAARAAGAHPRLLQSGGLRPGSFNDKWLSRPREGPALKGCGTARTCLVVSLCSCLLTRPFTCFQFAFIIIIINFLELGEICQTSSRSQNWVTCPRSAGRELSSDEPGEKYLTMMLNVNN